MRGHLRAFVLFSCFSLFAQDTLLQRPDVRKAFAFLEANHERHLAKQVQIAEIAAPTFHEAERGKFLAEEFRKLGLARVETDTQGNVLGWRLAKRVWAISQVSSTCFKRARTATS
jgi:hypothetical protein